MVRIVINADDFGLTDGINRAILGLFALDAISNTTIMSAAPGALDRVRAVDIERLRGRAGVHLQLTGGRPISSPALVTSLIDSTTGAFLRRTELDFINLDEVRIEWTAQIEAVIAVLNDRPTHLDSHQGVHRLRGCTEIYLDLASKYSLPVRGGADIRALMRTRGVCGSDVLIREWTGKGLGVNELKATIEREAASAPRDAVIEVVAHPAYSDQQLRKISSLNDMREGDRTSLWQLSAENWIAKHGHALVSFPLLLPSGHSSHE